MFSPANLARTAIVAGLLLAVPVSAVETVTNADTAFDSGALVQLEDIQTPIIDSGRLDGVLDVALVVQARTPVDAAALKTRLPELRAAALSGAMEFSRLYASPFAPVDARKLRAELSETIRQVDPAITDVLVVRVGAFSG